MSDKYDEMASNIWRSAMNSHQLREGIARALREQGEPEFCKSLTNMIGQLNLDTLKEVCDEATPGPWRWRFPGGMVATSHVLDSGGTLVAATYRSKNSTVRQEDLNAELIASARNFMPLLIEIAKLVKKAPGTNRGPGEVGKGNSTE